MQTMETGEIQKINKNIRIGLESQIKQSLYEKISSLKDTELTASIELEEDGYLTGKFNYTNKNNDNKEGIFFAAKINGKWEIAELSYIGYNGICQNFQKYNFPPDMTPDCWDERKNILVDTSNPERFYKNGFTKKDKAELKQSFISYMKKKQPEIPDFYLDKDLYIRIDKNTDYYVRGTALTGGSKNISAPYFLAVKQNDIWKVIFNGQDYPDCNILAPYNFPDNIIDKCFDESIKKLKSFP